MAVARKSDTGLFITRSMAALAEEEHQAHGPTLRRALGPWALVAIGLGNMVGAGIFATIGDGAHNLAGPAVTVSFLIAAIISAFAALCYAEIASMVRVAGSAYTYTYATVGELVAWVIGWNLIWEYGMASAPVASTFSSNIQQFLTSVGIKLPLWATSAYHPHAHTYFDVIAFIAVVGFSALLAVGIRESAGTNSLLVILKMGVLVAFIVIGLPFINPANWHPYAPHGWIEYTGGSMLSAIMAAKAGIIPGAFIVFFAFVGFDAVTTAAEEAHNPQKDVPIGVLGALGLGAFFYVTIAIVLTGMQPASAIDVGAPLAVALTSVGRGGWAWLTVAGAVIGTSSVILTGLLGQSRIFFVMARDGLLPKGVAKIHPRFRTPARMTMVVGLIIGIIAGCVPLDQLLALVNLGTLSAFVLVCIGVLVLRRTQPDRPRTFRTPLVPLVPILGVVTSLFLMVLGSQVITWIFFAGWLVVGLAIYFVYGHRHSEERKARANGGTPELGRL
ncbi:MAG: amino acid permease [Candidatus Eremiobacteraeota bacterium]|nr:amino acid permease [Candidatus Eremiobacteraeota bacterium]MBV8262374.1 amino acid permease [Candidatus Eremiobacteraeota bacterium]MBV8339947.1 amino acid permease [Candidatus Eremiobacteraeota bacterium]MBV8460342.1 amino acid permease [Candidatus Eremiobacteraeota bacterium]MBV8668767.1 amino acid permease [Candidatus Eremiobacteraeota bacterium]